MRRKVKRPEPEKMTATKFNCVCCETPLEARMWGSQGLRRVEVSTSSGWYLIRHSGGFFCSAFLICIFPMSHVSILPITCLFRLIGSALLTLHWRGWGCWLARCSIGSTTFGPNAGENSSTPRPCPQSQGQPRSRTSNDFCGEEYAMQATPWFICGTGECHSSQAGLCVIMSVSLYTTWFKVLVVLLPTLFIVSLLCARLFQLSFSPSSYYFWSLALVIFPFCFLPYYVLPFLAFFASQYFLTVCTLLSQYFLTVSVLFDRLNIF